jgi:hypothetical protein
MKAMHIHYGNQLVDCYFEDQVSEEEMIQFLEGFEKYYSGDFNRVASLNLKGGSKAAYDLESILRIVICEGERKNR